MTVHAALAGLLEPSRTGSMALHRQLTDGLREAILGEKLPGGTRLPSTRRLAADLGVSRNTVIRAYEQLVSEGFLASRSGDGTRVCEIKSVAVTARRSTRGRAGIRPAEPARHKPLSQTGALLDAVRPPATLCDDKAFVTGLPALEAFPHKLWARLVGRAIRDAPTLSLGAQSPGGYEPLRQVVALHLKLTRGVLCDPDQVLILPGAQAALDVTSRMLVGPGDAVWIEDPGYFGARAALEAAGARLHAIPVDDKGMDLAAAPSRKPALIYVTPSYQFPLGVTMTLERRMTLLELTRRHGAWVLEDDYDSDFRYQGRPLAALQGLDTDGSVIYTGTFSKTMFPSLRAAYMVVPRTLVQAFRAAVRLTGQETPMFVQVALHDFIANGHYRSHVRKMHGLYEARQDAFVRAVRAHLDDDLELDPGDAGMQLVAFYRDGKHRPGIEERAAEHGVNVRCLSNYHLGSPRRPGLFLGYAAVPERHMTAGVRRLRAALQACDERLRRD